MVTPTPTGVPGGGELGPQQHAGGGEGAEGQRQRAGADALPGGGSALQVGGPQARRAGGCWARGPGDKGKPCAVPAPPSACRASPPPRPPAPSCPEFESGGQPVGSRRALQHGNLLQCLAQCAEVTPYLLVMEFCPMVSGRAPHRPCSPCAPSSCPGCSEGGLSCPPGGKAAVAGTPHRHPVGLTFPLQWDLGARPTASPRRPVGRRRSHVAREGGGCVWGPTAHWLQVLRRVRTLSWEPLTSASLASREACFTHGVDTACKMPPGPLPRSLTAPDLLGAAHGRHGALQHAGPHCLGSGLLAIAVTSWGFARVAGPFLEPGGVHRSGIRWLTLWSPVPCSHRARRCRSRGPSAGCQQ